MKIAIFTDTFYPDINGVAQTLKKLTVFLEEQNIEYKIFAPESSLAIEYVSGNIHRFKSLSFLLYPECRLAFPNIPRIKSELQCFSPDLIHVATPFNIGLCGIYFSKKLNIPLVGSYHTDFDHYLAYYDLKFLSGMLWKYMRWFYRACRKLFVPSTQTLQLLNRHGFTNIEIWSRGVDCQLFNPHYEKRTVREKYSVKTKYLLTYVGRLAPEKDIQTLQSIAATLPSEIKKQLHWLIVGDGPLRKELEMKAEANMTFTGYLKGDELAEIYTSSDLFVFPSPTETFGNVVLEAMASGTPVIGANSGGIKGIIKEGITGYLCEPGNAKDFTNTIVKLLNNDHLRRNMGIAAREYALTQRWENIFQNLVMQYYEVLSDLQEKKYA